MQDIEAHITGQADYARDFVAQAGLPMSMFGAPDHLILRCYNDVHMNTVAEAYFDTPPQLTPELSSSGRRTMAARLAGGVVVGWGKHVTVSYIRLEGPGPGEHEIAGFVGLGFYAPYIAKERGLFDTEQRAKQVSRVTCHTEQHQTFSRATLVIQDGPVYREMDLLSRPLSDLT